MVVPPQRKKLFPQKFFTAVIRDISEQDAHKREIERLNRFYELISVYGTTFKELIHEEFGDGIMSAIDFKMDLTREPHDAGDRVNIVMSGKFLSYKTY